jgi:hypothetical protein
MELWNEPVPAGCESCPGCSGVGRNPGPGRNPEAAHSPGAEDAPPLHGWRLAGASAGIFLFPILTAAVGAGLAGPGGPAQLAGGILGLAAGIAAAAVTARRLRWTTEVRT